MRSVHGRQRAGAAWPVLLVLLLLLGQVAPLLPLLLLPPAAGQRDR